MGFSKLVPERFVGRKPSFRSPETSISTSLWKSPWRVPWDAWGRISVCYWTGAISGGRIGATREFVGLLDGESGICTEAFLFISGCQSSYSRRRDTYTRVHASGKTLERHTVFTPEPVRAIIRSNTEGTGIARLESTFPRLPRPLIRCIVPPHPPS